MLRKAYLDPFIFPMPPHPDVRHVLHVGEHDVVAGLKCKAMRRDVQAFGLAASDIGV
ncbi:MAG: hypothetical protein ABIR52_03520 [Casimicrobiaceae bacterium]